MAAKKLNKFVLFFSLFFLIFNPLFANSKSINNERLNSYLQFISTFDYSLGPCGKAAKGEIEILTDPERILEVEKKQKNLLIKRGLSPSEAEKMSQCGIIVSDTYWLFVRDAVAFPSGYEGTYNRVIWRSAVDGPGNVAILPVLNDGRIILCLNYRHSTRSWEIEIPRGIRHYGETPEKAGRRELRAETGCLTDSQVYLGSITPDTSTVSTVTPIFLGYVSEQIESDQEPSEAIVGLITLSKEEVKEAFVRGFIEVQIFGEEKKVPFRDSFLAFAFLQAEARGLI